MSTAAETPSVPRPAWAEGVLYADEWASTDRYFAPAGRLKGDEIPGEFEFRIELDTTGSGEVPRLYMYVDGMRMLLGFADAAEVEAFSKALMEARYALDV